MSNIQEGTQADRNEPIWETALTEERLVRVLRGVIAEERGSIGDNNLLRRIIEALESAEVKP
jgi:hypothetical protein